MCKCKLIHSQLIMKVMQVEVGAQVKDGYVELGIYYATCCVCKSR